MFPTAGDGGDLEGEGGMVMVVVMVMVMVMVMMVANADAITCLPIMLSMQCGM